MDDTISRQAAIDALKQFKPEIIPYEKARSYVEETIDTMYDRIEELPSAQPVATDTNVGDTTHKNVIYSPVQMAMDYAVNATDFSASSDTISRQAAIREYQKVCNGINCGECPFLIKVNTEKGSHLITDCKLEAFLHSLPSAERRGRWEDVEHAPNGLLYATCSVCGKRQTVEFTSYCPNCGADMRGKENE